MANLFNSIRVRAPKRNKFNLSHDVKLSTNFGRLTPFFCQETVPGDTFQVSADVLTRMQPLVTPIMQNINVYTHFFFVPNRLIWDEFETFITGGKNGDGISEITGKKVIPPSITFGDMPSDEFNNLFKDGELFDYLGIPASAKAYMANKTIPDLFVSALPIRAYQQIYNDYYRDENLTDPIRIDVSSGVEDIFMNGVDNYKCQYRAYPKDYFTSALPTPQRGQDVQLPLGGEADLVYHGTEGPTQLVGNALNGMLSVQNGKFIKDSSGNPVDINVTANTKVDLSSASMTTVTELRRALKMQEWLEKNARGGYRYIEQILSHFGVKSSDARLQRAQYLGGGKNPIVISDVLQTSATQNTGGSESPQGNMAGQGVGVSRVNSFKFFAEEHGFIIGIMSILPRASYFQGLPRMFSRELNEDYYWPEFAHLGEQEIKYKELYLTDDPGEMDEMDDTFGYTPRYAEYKYIPNSVHGDFRGNQYDSYKMWHLARDFGSLPRLNNKFVTCQPDASNQRVFALTDPKQDKFLNLIRVTCHAKRPMPYYGTPYL